MELTAILDTRWYESRVASGSGNTVMPAMQAPPPYALRMNTAPANQALVYDGDCAFCTRSAQWIAGRWAAPARIAPWQDLGPDGLAALGLTEAEARDAAWWVEPNGRRRRGHRAVAAAMSHANGWVRATGVVLAVPPCSWLGALVYPLIARYRHRLPGGTASCRVQ